MHLHEHPHGQMHVHAGWRFGYSSGDVLPAAEDLVHLAY